MKIFISIILFSLATGSGYAKLAQKDKQLYKAWGLFPVVEIEYWSAKDQSGYPSDAPFELRFDYKRSIKREALIKAADKELGLNDGGVSPFPDKLQALHQVYQDVDKEDSYRLSYFPDKGTQLFFNDELVFETPGHDFAKYYFSIWLKEAEGRTRLKN